MSGDGIRCRRPGCPVRNGHRCTGTAPRAERRRPRQGRASAAVEPALEGLVGRLDDLLQRLEPRDPGPFRLALASKPQQPDVLLDQLVLEVAAEVVPVADQRLSRPGGDEVCDSATSRSSRSRVRWPWPRSGRRRGAGPAKYTPGAHAGPRRSDCGRRSQYPYSAHPARSEGLTVSRERPHSTGVESTVHTSSRPMEVSVASTPVTRRSSSAALRRRLLQPGCFGR
jgi:hypothetical protein